MYNKKSFGPPPKRGPNPQGLKNGKEIKVPTIAKDTAKKIIKSKKYSEVNRAVNPKTKTTKNRETLRTINTDKSIFPTIYGKKNKLTKYSIDKDKYQSYPLAFLKKKAKDSNNLIDIPSTARSYVSAEDVSKALSNEIGKARNLRTGGINTGCPHRENGVKSDIKGISSIQIKGKKFIGVR